MSCEVLSVELPNLPADANKYSRGKLTLVAGSSRYPGAAVLAARASQRMGAGYTEVVTAPEAVDVVRLSSASLVVRSCGDWLAGDLPICREEKPCAVCIGPGFEGSDDEADALAAVLGSARCPVVVDGGALGLLGADGMLDLLSRRHDTGLSTVVTPHGGEAEGLARAAGVIADEPATLSNRLACALSAIVVLKGPDTYISDGQRVYPMREGTPALAKAGTGDVLAGMIGALLAQGVDPLQAAFSSAALHARAGVLASEALSEVSVIAEDVIDSIPAAIDAACAERGPFELDEDRLPGDMNQLSE